MGLFVLTRIFLVGIGVLAWSHQLPNSNWRGPARSGIYYALVIDQPFLDMWTRWDSWEYEEIAREGYWYDYNAKPQPYGTVACFPLYPLSIRAVGKVLGGRYVLGGLIVSNVSALVGFVLLFQWATWWRDHRAAWLAVSAAITFPAGLFWSALYPQSLFFALSIGSLTLMLDGRVAPACLLASLATATRLEGVAIIPALLAIQLQRDRCRLSRESLWLLITPLGLIAYMGYLGWRWGDPLLFLSVHKNFGRGIANPFWTLVEPLLNPREVAEPSVIWETYAVIGLIVLGHMARLKMPILLYAWLLLLIPLSSGVYLSIYRVHLVNAPIYLAIGLGLRGRWRFLGWAMVVLFAWMQGTMMFNWVSGYFLP